MFRNKGFSVYQAARPSAPGGCEKSGTCNGKNYRDQGCGLVARARGDGMGAVLFALWTAMTFMPQAAGAQDPAPGEASVVQETSDDPDAPQPQELVTPARPNPLQDPRDRVYYPGDTEHFKPLAQKLWGNFLL